MHLLVDTDPGIDDALALALALASPEITIEGISTVAGNVPVDQATTNALRVLRATASAVWPRLAEGAAAPLERPLVTAGHIHGDDGLGNLHRVQDHTGEPRYPRPDHTLEMRDGPDLILEVADRLGGELTIVALGPLTNLAIALGRDRRALSRVGRVVVMGGAVTVPGNTTPAAEFNFYVDPEAAAAVLESGLPVELVPLDVTHQVLLREASLAERAARCASPICRFAADIARHGFAGEGGGAEALYMHDPLAVGVALDPSLVGFEDLHVEVECAGSATRGMSVADRRRVGAQRKRPPNCRVALSVDADRFLALFLDRLCPASR